MYVMNDTEKKIVDLYKSGNIQKAINHTTLIGYDKPILVNVKLQNVWLSTEKLKDLCGIYDGVNYNPSMPWLFLIHHGQLKVMPLAPIVHSISYDMLDEHGLVCINDSGIEESTYITVWKNNYMVSLLDSRNNEYLDLYNYILSEKISQYLLYLEDISDFNIDYMEEYGDFRIYDRIWTKDSNIHKPCYFGIQPQEFMDWIIHPNYYAYLRKSASGNKMSWLPVLRWHNGAI